VEEEVEKEEEEKELQPEAKRQRGNERAGRRGKLPTTHRDIRPHHSLPALPAKAGRSYERPWPPTACRSLRRATCSSRSRSGSPFARRVSSSRLPPPAGTALPTDSRAENFQVCR